MGRRDTDRACKKHSLSLYQRWGEQGLGYSQRMWVSASRKISAVRLGRCCSLTSIWQYILYILVSYCHRSILDLVQYDQHWILKMQDRERISKRHDSNFMDKRCVGTTIAGFPNGILSENHKSYPFRCGKA